MLLSAFLSGKGLGLADESTNDNRLVVLAVIQRVNFNRS
jgi:hypothetical protein